MSKIDEGIFNQTWIAQDHEKSRPENLLGTSWGCFGLLGTSWGCFGCVLGGTWALLGESAMRLKSLLERLGAAWGMSWAHIGKNNQKDARGIIKMTPPGDPTWRPKLSKFDVK